MRWVEQLSGEVCGKREESSSFWGVGEGPYSKQGPFELSQEDLVSYGVKGTNKNYVQSWAWW